MTTIKLLFSSAAAISLLLVAVGQRDPVVEAMEPAGESIVTKDTDLFIDHWLRAAGLVTLLAALRETSPPEPAVKMVATETITPPAADPSAAVAVAPRPQEKHVELDVCQRHHLRKIITHGGRSWRCRR